MAKRKTPYQKKPFESDGSRSDISANIYLSMVLSEAWRALTAQQHRLYVYCKMQYYGEKSKPVPDDPLTFTMNQSKWMKEYDLYKEGNKAGFYRDMGALISHGFISCVSRGGNGTFKTIYRFSSRWQKYGTPDFEIPQSEMTTALYRKSKAKV